MSDWDELSPLEIDNQRLRAELAAERGRADQWKSEIEQVADVWEVMWRGKHKEALAEWIVPDMLHYVSERESWLEKAEAERDALRAGLVKVGEALETITNTKPYLHSLGGDYLLEAQKLAATALTEIRKLLEGK